MINMDSKSEATKVCRLNLYPNTVLVILKVVSNCPKISIAIAINQTALFLRAPFSWNERRLLKFCFFKDLALVQVTDS